MVGVCRTRRGFLKVTVTKSVLGADCSNVAVSISGEVFSRK